MQAVTPSPPERLPEPGALKQRIQSLGRALGFSQTAVTGIDLAEAEVGLKHWLDAGFHGSMAYMASHGAKRARPAELVPGTVSVITARMDYLPRGREPGWAEAELARLARPGEAVVSVYARGRDYHKVLRQRLQKLADALAAEVGPFGHRVFTDSAPVMEVALAERAGLGWRGKHTLLLHREAGSMFFLGEIYTTLPLPADKPEAPGGHCGTCTACIGACPTQAIVAPYRLDARRCISYLTIEHAGPIPEPLRLLVGNRIYGCDDCQLVCPWNKYARRSALPDYDERVGLSGQQLVTLFGWSESEFLAHTEGSAIRRIGHERWQRNLAVALGNALRSPVLDADDARRIRATLSAARPAATPLVQEHIDWALTAQAVP
jgi:epoxyqueuosine reductase